MSTLAQVVVFLMEQLAIAEEIDWQACGELSNEMWLELANATVLEREALKEAATTRLGYLLADPDEYGYTPRALVTPEQREFLHSLANGSAWDEFDNPDANER